MRAGVWERAARSRRSPSAPRRGADVPRVRVVLARVEDRRRPRRPADRREHAERLPLASLEPPAAVLRRVSRSTRSTPSSARRSRRTSCARRPSCARRSTPARSPRPAQPTAAPARACVDQQAHRLPQPRSSTRRSKTATSSATRRGAAHAREGAEAGADVPGDGRAGRAGRRGGRAGRRSPDQCRRRCAARRRRRSRRAGCAGMRPSDIAAELGLAKATVTLHLRRLGAEGPATYVGRRAIVATLGGVAASASASCATSESASCACTRRPAPTSASRTPRPRPASARSKSALICVDELVAHLDRLRRAGYSTEPEALPLPEPPRWPHGSPACGRDRRRGGRARVRSGSTRGAFRRCRTRRLTRCGAPTSRSRCWPTASTCCGS